MYKLAAGALALTLIAPLSTYAQTDAEVQIEDKIKNIFAQEVNFQ